MSTLTAPTFFYRATALACLMLGHAGWALAQSTGPSFAIKGFDIEGPNPLDTGETMRVLTPFMKGEANMETLQKATAELEAALRLKGFGLYRVSLPAQELGGRVKLAIVRFTIGKVDLENQGQYSNQNIRGSLPSLQESSSPNLRHLATETSLANESVGKHVTVVLRESDNPDQIDAVVKVKPQSHWSGLLSLNNTGTQATGKDRVTASMTHGNLFDMDQQFTFAYTTSFSKPSDVRQYGLSYRAPIYPWGGMLSISHTGSDVVGSFGSFSSTGAGRTLGVNYSIHIPSQGAYKGYVNFGFDDKYYNGSKLQAGGVTSLSTLDSRSRTLSIGYSARSESENSSWNYGLDLVGNIRGGHGNDLFHYSNGNKVGAIQHERWAALRLAGQYVLLTPAKWTLSFRGNAQLTQQTLISGEQFGGGGSTSVRGTSERALSGDKGIFASIEAGTPEWSSGMRGVLFIDAARLSNNAVDLGSNRIAIDGLTSAGLGLRMQTDSGLIVSADYARLLKGSAIALSNNSASPQKGDDKIHMTLAWRF